MSYPAYFDPGNWDEDKAIAFKDLIMQGCADQAPEVQAAWSLIADKLIEAANTFQSIVATGIVQVMMQANNEADENEMYLKFRIYQRTYGAIP